MCSYKGMSLCHRRESGTGTRHLTDKPENAGAKADTEGGRSHGSTCAAFGAGEPRKNGLVLAGLVGGGGGGTAVRV